MAKVLVTGATGFIAAHTILALLDKGHEVRGTARSAAKAASLNEALSTYSGKPVSLDIFPADLMNDEGWAEAVAGCDYVQHLASPLPAKLPRNDDDLIIPAREGALRALKFAKAAGVKRVVMTSSMASVAYGWREGTRPDPLTEEHWTNPDYRPDNTGYTRSKVIAERAAWDYMAGEGAGMELACINPVLVLGPLTSPGFSASVEAVTQVMRGKMPATPKVGFQLVDVRDVADAHVSAMTVPEAAGERFIVGTEFLWYREVVDILREAFPAYAKKLPKGELPDFLVKGMSLVNPVLKQIIPELGKRRFASNEKARRVLDWNPRSAREAILASAETLIQHGKV